MAITTDLCRRPVANDDHRARQDQLSNVWPARRYVQQQNLDPISDEAVAIWLETKADASRQHLRARIHAAKRLSLILIIAICVVMAGVVIGAALSGEVVY